MVRPLGRLCPDPQPATCWGVERWAAPMTSVCAYPTQANGRLEWATRRFWVFRSAKFSVCRPPFVLGVRDGAFAMTSACAYPTQANRGLERATPPDEALWHQAKSTPTLREEREGWGTLIAGIEGVGPTRQVDQVNTIPVSPGASVSESTSFQRTRPIVSSKGSLVETNQLNYEVA